MASVSNSRSSRRLRSRHSRQSEPSPPATSRRSHRTFTRSRTTSGTDDSGQQAAIAKCQLVSARKPSGIPEIDEFFAKEPNFEERARDSFCVVSLRLPLMAFSDVELAMVCERSADQFAESFNREVKKRDGNYIAVVMPLKPFYSLEHLRFEHERLVCQ